MDVLVIQYMKNDMIQGTDSGGSSLNYTKKILEIIEILF